MMQVRRKACDVVRRADHNEDNTRMPKNEHCFPYQKGVIGRSCQEKDTLANQKLGELVSELYLCNESRMAQRLWERARKALLDAGANMVRVERLVTRRSVKALAQLANKLAGRTFLIHNTGRFRCMDTGRENPPVDSEGAPIEGGENLVFVEA